MPGTDFDIYQTGSGYVAVTNEVRRAILAALAKKERQLPELVKLTKKAKPTLSSVHMRELLATKLIEELPHPTDKRKKIYRLKARRIGTSSLPVGELRSAVREYAGAGGTRLSVAQALDVLAAAPASATEASLRAQARRLGTLLAPTLQGPGARESVAALSALLEREQIARPLRLDLEGASLEVEIDQALEGDPARLAALLAALAEGALARGGEEARVRVAALHARRVTLALPGGA